MFATQLDKHLITPRKTILYLFNPEFNDYVDNISHKTLVYHAYDDYSKWDNYDTIIAQKEKSILLRADLIFTSSAAVKQRLEEISGRNDITFLPNGVDYLHFSNPNHQEPKDLATIPHPRVGYVGSINKKIDLALLKKLALKFNKYSFVMVGPINRLDKDDIKELEELHKLGNVYFLGNKNAHDLPSYMHNFSINIMLYKTTGNTWASSCYPLKLHEYLAVGKPVISPNIEAVKEFSNVVSIPNCLNDWFDSISQNIDLQNTANMTTKRQNTAAKNTWENRIKLILSEIQKV